jgi:serine/threonine-protein kinase
MEYLRGPTLATYLRHLHQRKKRVPLEQVARLLKQLTSALDYAHGQGVIHRDIKPGNILLHTKTDNIPLDQTLPNDVEAIVTDFGLVRVVNAASQTVSGFISGTPAYASPEQARGDQTDHRTDLYSLGVVLYEILAGRIPFEADNTVTILHMHLHMNPAPIPGISPKVQAVVDRALRKNPDERYQSSQEMAVDFYRAIGMRAQADSIRVPKSQVSAEPVEKPSEVAVSWLPKPAPPESAPVPAVSEPKPQPAPIVPEPAPKSEPALKEPEPAPVVPKPAPKPEPPQTQSRSLHRNRSQLP